MRLLVLRMMPASCRQIQELQADSLPVQRLEELNRALDEYILRHPAHRGRAVSVSQTVCQAKHSILVTPTKDRCASRARLWQKSRGSTRTLPTPSSACRRMRLMQSLAAPSTASPVAPQDEVRPEEIKKAYRVVAMQCHPDKGALGGFAFYYKAFTTTPHMRSTSFVMVNSPVFGVRRASAEA